MGWLPSWNYRIKITVNNSYVDADLTDFPMYVDLADLPAGFHTYVNQTDGRDIRVTEADGFTEVPREVVFYDAATDTGELHFKGDILNSTDVDFYIYYGNTSATEPAIDSTYGAENVWRSEYKGVWHFPNGSTLTTLDSTLNDNDATATGVNASVGKLGGGASADAGEEIDFGTGNSLNVNGNGTFEFWAQQNGDSLNGTYTGYLARFNAAITAGYQIYNLNSDHKIGFYSNTSCNVKSSYVISDTNWHHVVVTDDGSYITFYVDGNQIGSPIAGTSVGTTSAAHHQIIGFNNINTLNGQIDEFRISNWVASSTWISTEYNNQNDPSSFFTIGAAEVNAGVMFFSLL